MEPIDRSRPPLIIIIASPMASKAIVAKCLNNIWRFIGFINTGLRYEKIKNKDMKTRKRKKR
ncbi:MAG: hypothetical protein QXI49_06835 [Candidatus Methanomethylicaceae archaeon]